MANTLYLAIMPMGLGMLTLVVSLICLFGYITTDDIDTKRKLWPWFNKLFIVAVILLGIGVYLTSLHFKH